MAGLDDLFTGGLESKMGVLNDTAKPSVGNDGIYRIDLSKVKDKKKGWRSVVRFLPNITKDGNLGEVAIKKISHYVNIKNPKELSGWFDSPKNFEEKCALSDLYWNLQNTKNAILIEKSKHLNYSERYYSYVLVVEDEQNPELVGKIMIFQYGKTIREKIIAERNGEISGVSCNVFDLSAGKDFVLIVKEIQTGDETYPDYKMCMFRPETSSLPVYFKDKGAFKNVPLDENGSIVPSAHSMVKDFLLDRDHDLEDYAPKRLTEEQNAKITEISNFLTGKSSNSFESRQVSTPTSEDFDFDDNFSASSSSSSSVDTEDDFFADL
jgi:hypothetical protein